MKVTQEQMQVIEQIANRLASKFKFGFHELDDIKQQARLFALEGLEAYDGIRPLENFLWTHVRNRLYNFKRNNYFRPEKPCDACPLFENQKCMGFTNMEECDLYYKWKTRKEKKQALVNSSVISTPVAEDEPDLAVLIDSKDLFDLIDLELHVDFREDWIRFTNSLKLPTARKDKLLEEIHNILEEHSLEPQDR